ncbi:hypothetical protein [Pseudomonas frederiksbergensis]|uniref:Uncharacterized protein n=1 Tax=Pseudomonas frederiksbergensis TaxID=104087 RepID=A0A423K7M2_9PSED|nr:hypothetical protein [Pseudomonas frederiksbergensis]RON47750.1 hypothetical protein BK665_25710 [Pseudomonas frederiksbergensis]
MSTFVRSLTVEIFNASAADITVNYALLTGGEWTSPPIPGSVICSTQQRSYVNGVTNTLSSLGGQILLMPAAGGSITPIWTWPSDSRVSGSVSNAATDLAVSNQMINTQTNNPTMQIVISNATTFSKFDPAVKKADL